MFGKSRKKRVNAHGKGGEDLAVKYLETHGYRVLDRNYTTNVGEVDIFATDERTLIAVEVKSRLSLEYGAPAEAVGHDNIAGHGAVYKAIQTVRRACALRRDRGVLDRQKG